MSATLSSKRSIVVDRDALAKVSTPPSTLTWQPVPHIDLVQTLTHELEFRGHRVMRESFCISPNHAKMFGVFDLDTPFDAGMGISIGFRNSHDKSLSVTLVAGARVFVCDNLALYGDETLVQHKHTSRFNIANSITLALDRHQGQQAKLAEFINSARNRFCTAQFGGYILGVMFSRGILTQQTFLESFRLFTQPDSENAPDCAERSLWGLHNALTRAFKSLPPNVSFRRTQEATRYLSNNVIH